MLDELRKKPRAIRILYAFWGALGLTLILAGIWLLSTLTRFSDIESNPMEGVDEASGAFSQFIEKAKQKLSNSKKDSVDSAPVTSTSTTETKPVATSSQSSSSIFLISTSSPEKVQIGTSSKVAE